MIGNPAHSGYTSISRESSMPLRDHFRPPISKKSSWEGFHGGWPMKIIDQLLPHLPPGYIAEPRVHLGSLYELDINAYEDFDAPPSSDWTPGLSETATLASAAPTLTLEADLTEEYAYEVLVFDEERNRKLVAAVELVSPGNKDRPESRSAFISKCAALLQQRVCVSIVDLVTTRNFNLYTDLLELIHRADPAFDLPPSTYAATIRGRNQGAKALIDTWAYPLSVGKKLPTLPIWLNADLKIEMDLESSYEATCRALRIP